MNKYISARPGLLRRQRGETSADEQAGNRWGLGWLLPALCWYLLWVYVIVSGFMPLQLGS